MAQDVIVEVYGEKLGVPGRAGRMIVYLAEEWDRVNVAEKGSVTFDFGFSEITPRINAIDPAMSTKDLI